MKFFLGLNPEDPVISPSLLTKFRRQRLKNVDLLNILLTETVQLAIEQGVLTDKGIIVDATHTPARFNQKSPVETLRDSAKILRKRLYKTNPAIKAQLPEKNRVNELAAEKQYTADLIKAVKAHLEVSAIQGVPEALHSLQEKQDDIQEASRYSTDKDAKVGHKSATIAFFGYKTHFAMTPRAHYYGGDRDQWRKRRRTVSRSFSESKSRKWRHCGKFYRRYRVLWKRKSQTCQA